MTDYLCKKNVAEDCLGIDVFWLKKNGYLEGLKKGSIQWSHSNGNENNIGISGKIDDHEKYIQFTYSIRHIDGEKQDFDYRVKVITTPCNLGGHRYWFVCPLSKEDKQCMKRVGKLYLPPGGKYFGCRHCYSLSYTSRNDSNNNFSAFSQAFSYERKAKKLEASIKRKFYDHQPTKRFKKYIKYMEKFGQKAPLLSNQLNRLFPK